MKQAKAKADLPVVFPEVSFQRRALVIDNVMPFGRWLRLGELLEDMEDGMQLWIGDYLNTGEKIYGEKYAQAVNMRQADRWKNYAWVARSVEKSSRKDFPLRYKHYEAVAPLEPLEQKKWLKAAVENGWGVAELRREIGRERMIQDPPPRDDFQPLEPPVVLPEVEPEFEEVSAVKPSRFYPEVPQTIGDGQPPPRPINLEVQYHRIVGIVRAFRAAERLNNDGEANRQRTAMDFFLAEIDRREERAAR
jgi:hypothetical protein